MRKRGKILRDTSLGPGLLMIEGRQYHFDPQACRTVHPPRPGQAVDVELSTNGTVQALHSIPDAQLAGESQPARRHPILLSLAAVSLLAAAWFFLPAASILLPFPGTLDFTFWQILGFLNSGTRPELLDSPGGFNTGLYGAVSILVLTAPFLSPLSKSRSAALSGLLPLLFMIVVAAAFGRSVASLNSLSLGIGAYLSILIGIYLAIAPLKSLLAATPKNASQSDSTQKRAA